MVVLLYVPQLHSSRCLQQSCVHTYVWPKVLICLSESNLKQPLEAWPQAARWAASPADRSRLAAEQEPVKAGSGLQMKGCNVCVCLSLSECLLQVGSCDAAPTLMLWRLISKSNFCKINK